MDVSILSADPVGSAQNSNIIVAFVSEMKAKWEAIKAELGKKVSMIQGVKFLLSCLDDLVLFVANLDLANPDKKATVLVAISVLYDYVTNGVMPLWMRPFAKLIKDFVINTLISVMIDWTWSKYKNGNWKSEVKE
jgi:hypothetical protein